MSKIYEKNPVEGVSSSDIGKIHEDKTTKGKEASLTEVDVIAKRNNKFKEIKDKFLRRRSVGSPRPSAEKSNESLVVIPSRDDQFVLESFEKMNALRKINDGQPHSGHKFKLPPTIRLVEEADGSYSILVSNLRQKGKEYLDMKIFYEFSHSLDPKIKQSICDLIRQDLDLAEANHIALNSPANLNFPLDTWHVVIDQETKEAKVYIVDVGNRVQLDVSDEDLKRTRERVEEGLDLFLNGPPKG